MTDIDPKDPAFTELLSSLRKGSFLHDARQAVAEVEEAVMELGKPGTVTITLTLRPASKGNREMVSITDAIAVKKPVGEKEETILYRAGDGRFTRRDPRQPELPVFPVARDQYDPATGERRESNG